MFKFKALEPHLTSFVSQSIVENVDLENRKPNKNQSHRQKPHNSSPRKLRTRNWVAQGLKALGEPQRFRSSVIEFEVRLAQALEQCSRNLNGKDALKDAPGKPDVATTAVHCQMLDEVCEACGPFQTILKKIHSALARAIYSSYFVSEAGSLQFDQTPYFVVVERLEEEKAFLLREKDDFRDLLLRREVGHPSGRLSKSLHGTSK
eukprot:jgi/Botrbrau1/2755/Bobra.0164s0034.1